MSNLMEQLNPAQLEAVLHKDGPLLIVAGAGTGKTHLLTQKIGYIIEQAWAKPEEILALTFTDKAANEMEERVDRLLPMGYVDLWISTFHGFAEKIIKAHGLDIGLPTDFKLLNEFEQWILVNKNLERFELSYYRPTGNPTKFIGALLKHFSRLKDENIAPAEYLEYATCLAAELAGGAKSKKTNSNLLQQLRNSLEVKELTEEMVEQEVARIMEVAKAYAVYQKLLVENSSLDFGDLIGYALKLFKERPLILAQYKEQFKYVLVDEFQDTNWAQYELVKILAGEGNLIVVGDDDQSIYRFRGASMSNILQFKTDYPTAHQVVLTENYRSYQGILDISYDFIKLNNPNRLECQLDEKLNKKLVAVTDGLAEIKVIEGLDLEDEVKQVLLKIYELKNTDPEAGWGDFAVLVRANDSAKDFCAAFERAEIPYQFLASRGLYVKPLIMDIVAYLKLLDDYHESRAMYRILNMPLWGFTQKELVDLNFHANKKAWSLFETARNCGQLHLGVEVEKKLFKVMSLLSNHSKIAREKHTTELVLAFVNDSGLLKELTLLPGERAKEELSYLNQFMKRVHEFEQGSDDKTVKSFLVELNMEIQAGEQGSLAPDVEIGPDTIKVMTVHASKGLEFKYVFIANMVDKRFPAIERSEAIKIPNALVKENVPEGDVHLEEERRLFYVAMTRAKVGLYFSWSPDYGGARKKKPSRFLSETNLVVVEKAPARKNKTEVEAEKFAKVEKKQLVATEDLKPNLSYLSYSQLAAFQNCPYQYRFAHILRIPMRGKGVFSFGKTMHSTLQKTIELVRERRGTNQEDLFGENKLNLEPKIELEEIYGFYEESWIDEWYHSKKQKEEYYDKGKIILKAFFDKHKDAWPENYLTEKGFNLKVADGLEVYTVRGTIDRVDKTATGLKIIDYKTGTPKDKLTFDEKEQLLIYQLAVKEIFKEEVSSLAFYYLEDNREVEFLGTSEELVKVKTKIIETVQEIKKGDFTATPSPLCKFCDFFDICEFRKG